MNTNTTSSFKGFPGEGLDFLGALAGNNDRDFFEANRDVYERGLLQPAKALVLALGDELRQRVSPAIRAEPRVNGSILRINRDTRFSGDKRPYKEYFDLLFWEGEGHSRELPGFFLRLHPDRVQLAAGMHRFPPPVLARYRDAVVDERSGAALEAAIAEATRARGCALGEPTRKRVPPGYPADHPRAELLRRDAVFVHVDEPLPALVQKRAFVGWAATRMERMAPVQRWILETLL